MYQPETILSLKEPRSTEDQPFAYDRVRVVGVSPINHSGATAEWTGGDGQGVIIQPLTDFGSTLDEPFGKLQLLYEVESVPELEIPRAAPIKVINSATASAGPTPEEVFKKEAPGVKSEDGKRGRTPLSPLTVPEKDRPSASPLGDATAKGEDG